MTPAATFCLVCRAMLDRDQPCDCTAQPNIVALDAGAAERIDAALRVEPVIDWRETMERLFATLFYGPGAVAMVFLAAAFVVRLVWPPMDEAWPEMLGIPWLIVTLGWIVFFLYSEVSQLRAYYKHGPPARAHGTLEQSEVGVIESGLVLAIALHQRGDVSQPVVRDAYLEEELILRRTGEKITVPAGRIELVVPDERWRTKRGGRMPLWSEHLPKGFMRAGTLMEAKNRPGEQIALFDGTLEEAGASEGSFRLAAEQHFRWVPSEGRVRIKILA